MVEQVDSYQGSSENTDVSVVVEDKWITALEINEVKVSIKLDTGAKANLISEQDIREMKIKPHIKQKTFQLKAYNGQSIERKGTCRLKVKVKNRDYHLMFVVVPDGHDSVLGDKACEELGLVKRVHNIKEAKNPGQCK